jgi:hypothetical protein
MLDVGHRSITTIDAIGIEAFERAGSEDASVIPATPGNIYPEMERRGAPSQDVSPGHAHTEMGFPRWHGAC